MSKMTDEQVVRTLAEFMGYEVEHPTDYLLNSYDAVAEVWRKLDPYSTLTVADAELQKDWFDHPPREHAYALAKAIADAKEKQDA